MGREGRGKRGREGQKGEQGKGYGTSHFCKQISATGFVEFFVDPVFLLTLFHCMDIARQYD